MFFCDFSRFFFSRIFHRTLHNHRDMQKPWFLFRANVFLICCAIFWIFPVNSVKNKNLVQINDTNWRDILKGEWMINFFSRATWCPACKEMERPWHAFADWSATKIKRIKVAQVDISENPGLSGRFLVTALPSLYHVKDGVFRMYNGPKDKDDFIKFVKQKQWSSVEKTPSWCYPDSFQMSMVSALFKFSMKARDFHNHLVEKKGVPSLLSFGVFASVTLVVGCILGFFMVLIIDQFVPKAKKRSKNEPTAQNSAGQSKKDKKNGKNQQHQMNGSKENKMAEKPNNKNCSLTNGSTTDKEKTQISTQVKNTKNAGTDKKRD